MYLQGVQKIYECILESKPEVINRVYTIFMNGYKGLNMKVSTTGCTKYL